MREMSKVHQLCLEIVRHGPVDHPPGVGIQAEREVEVEGEKGTINLPAARILGSSLDENKTKLYDRDLGLLRVRGDDALMEEARQDAIDNEQVSGSSPLVGSPFCLQKP
jgi:uncharacterized protein DUF4230